MPRGFDCCDYWVITNPTGIKCKGCSMCIAEVRSIKEAREAYERVIQQRLEF